MTARRQLAELDTLTAQLRDRVDAWCRQLRRVEREDARRRDRGRLAQAVQQGTVAALLTIVGLALAVQPGHQEPAPAEHQWSRPATAGEQLRHDLIRDLELWRAQLDTAAPQPRVGRRAPETAGRPGR